MPIVYQDRCYISLYDAQYNEGQKVPIPQNIIDLVLSALLRFKWVCQDFRVRDDRIKIVATEATRQALNSEEYRSQIESRTGWKVDLLPKEEEGRIGAMGIASSFSSIKGLALDLGGGSIQLTWIIAKDGIVEMNPKGSVSFPFGAAALMNHLGTTPEPQMVDQLQNEIASNFEKAIGELGIPSSLAKDAKNNGLTLYLSGGGFRGWGYILMSMHAVKPYPIPIINGFSVLRSGFLPDSAKLPSNDSVFRISSRRASQVPAVTCIVKALAQSLPNIANICFAQGGVREGLLFSTLSPSIRSQNPLVTATAPYASFPPQTLVTLLQTAIPSLSFVDPTSPTALFSSPNFLTSVIQLQSAHSSLPKEVRPAAALRSTTTGLIASAHGISHEERALIALVLCERWGGELSPSDAPFRTALTQIVGPEASWWAKYVGRIAHGLGDLFPAGLVRPANDDGDLTIEMTALWGDASAAEKTKKKSSNGTERVVALEFVSAPGAGITEDLLEGWRVAMEKVGKKKHWMGDHRNRAYGWRVEAYIRNR